MSRRNLSFIRVDMRKRREGGGEGGSLSVVVGFDTRLIENVLNDLKQYVVMKENIDVTVTGYEEFIEDVRKSLNNLCKAKKVEVLDTPLGRPYYKYCF